MKRDKLMSFHVNGINILHLYIKEGSRCWTSSAPLGDLSSRGASQGESRPVTYKD